MNHRNPNLQKLLGRRRAAISVFCVVLLLASWSWAKIDAVYITPSTPDNTDQIVVQVYGWYPCFNTYPQGATIEQWGDTVHICSHAIMPVGMCFPAIREYYDSLQFGPLAAGEYTVMVSDSSPDYRYLPLTVSSNPDCCVGQRGNVDSDLNGQVDIADLVFLVDYMFAGGPPPACAYEADLNGDGPIDIADLVYMVDYMFAEGLPPGACP
jgi:hypothetical protein